MHRREDSPIPWFPDSPIPGFPDSRIPCFKDSLLRLDINKLVPSCWQACYKLVADNLATALSQQPRYKSVNKLLQACFNKLGQAVRTHPKDKLLEQHCYKSTAGLLQLVRFYHWAILNISGDRALASGQSKMCDRKHGGYWPNLRHFDVTIDLFLWRIPLTKNTNVKKTEIHTPLSICLKWWNL